MKICFIGSNGFMAKAFGKYLREQEIHVFGRTMPEYEFKKFTPIDLLSVDFDFESFADFEAIFYFAGEGVQSGKPSIVSNIYAVNTFVPIKLITGLNSIGYKGSIITFGSYAEIGSTRSSKAFTEKNLIQSTLAVPNDYTVSKRLLSRFISSYNSNVRILHFIIPTIYGKGENQNRLIPYLLKCKMEGEKSMLTSGSQVRQYLYIDELPVIVNMAIQNKCSGIYNIAGPDVYSVREIVSIVSHTFKIPSSDIIYNSSKRWDTSMHSLILDGSKLEAILGYKPKMKLIDTVGFYR